MTLPKLRTLLVAGLVATLSACGGSDSGNTSSTPPLNPPPVSTVTVGGTVSGLANGQTLVLQNNGKDNLTLSANGSFTFTTQLSASQAYVVSILTQPVSQTCTLANTSGTIAATAISNVTVSCVNNVAQSTTSGSTAFAVLSVGASRVAFAPTATGVIPVTIDGPAIAGTTVSLAGAAPASSASGLATSFAVNACTVDNSALKVACINYFQSKAAFFDVSKFATSGNLSDIAEYEVDLQLTVPAGSFSGVSGCLACGIVALPDPVPANSQFVVSSGDGYRVYNYPAQGTAAITPATTYKVAISENFAVNPNKKWIIASAYKSNGGTRPLNIINHANGKVYLWDTFTDTCASSEPAACQDFSFEEVDSVAFDPVTNIMELNSENGLSQLYLDMSQATFDDSKLTFSAPHSYQQFQTGATSGELSGALASGSGSWVFIVSEFEAGSATVGVASLPKAGGSGGVFPAINPNPVFVNLAALNYAPCTSAPQPGVDPHAQGYTTTAGGKPMGLFISRDQSCIAKIDLQALYNAKRSSTDSTVLDTSVDPVASGIVSFYKVK